MTQDDGVIKITSKGFWSDYWKSKQKSLYQIITRSYLFADIFRKYLPKDKKYSFLEIGGFPGFFCIYFSKFFGYSVALMDYYIDRNIIDNLKEINGVRDGIKLIESDLFNHEIIEQFDVVLSSGFIEHFFDTDLIVKKHIEFTKRGGYIIIALPNFRGLNGYVQKIFDPENLAAHNLSCMDVKLLKKMLTAYDTRIIFASYYGNFAVWLERIHERNILLRIAVRLCNVLGKIFVRFNSKVFSPFIVLVAKRKS